ncbi:MAG: hypothetical protein KF745_11450 [Phycisphaeraceae bacterium]|nr:hypothetical protein [Phycisphaeraceae bacterium]
MGACVLLEHTLPDGSVHFDWLFEPDGPPLGGLLSFRVQERMDQPGCTEVRALSRPDHRRAYLEFEGEVSGGRGSVRRIAAGECVITERTDARLDLTVAFGEGPSARWVGHRLYGPPEAMWWHFVRQR